ncbi:arginase family protein [Bifidobacterium dentium]|uniref:arginase family protein n=1 Tax=Bifidobacterium dentium TaxID=1689 RepID=UPI0018B01C76|nr:arginase family protein [Bifidobacterium dentium]MBF9699981.1 arginase family protein [Bifidobacterium dentium]
MIGGDHSISYPIIYALHDSCEGEMDIIHFDAHLDLVDENHLQGKYSQSSEIRSALELERVNPEHVVQIGLRGIQLPLVLRLPEEPRREAVHGLERAGRRPLPDRRRNPGVAFRLRQDLPHLRHRGSEPDIRVPRHHDRHRGTHHVRVLYP